MIYILLASITFSVDINSGFKMIDGKLHKFGYGDCVIKNPDDKYFFKIIGIETNHYIVKVYMKDNADYSETKILTFESLDKDFSKIKCIDFEHQLLKNKD